MAKVEQPKLPPLPASLQPFEVQPGVHRRGIKAAWFGRWKAGKSRILSWYPSPKVVVDCGEGGISLFCDKRVDKIIEASDLETYGNALDYAIEHQDIYQSVVVDDMSELWANWMDDWQTLNLRENEDIGAKHWRHIKGPWKRRLRQLNRSRMHVGISSRLKDTEYYKPESAPGEEETKLSVRKVVTPEIEKNAPYIVDLLFYTEALFDHEGKPTPEHMITFWAGRVPPKLASSLYIGKTWNFDAREPESVWDRIIGPLHKQWEDGAVEHLGIDPEVARKAMEEIELEGMDADEGLARRILRKKHESLAQYEAEWTQLGLSKILSGMPGALRQELVALHKKKRAELEAR